MIIDTSKGFTKILADEGKKITDKKRTFFSDFICVAKNGNAEEYEEVGREIWKHFIEEENPDVVELQERVKDVQDDVKTLQETSDTLNESQLMTDETVNIVMEAVTDSDEKHENLTDVILLAIDEMYQMLEPLEEDTTTLSMDSMCEVSTCSLSAPKTLSNINIKEGHIMVQLYAVMVQRGLKTIEQVPARYRDQVKALLDAVEE